MASLLGRFVASGAKSALMSGAKTAAASAKGFALQHKNQAIQMTQNYLKKKAGNVGRAANARVNSYIKKIGPQNQSQNKNKNKKTSWF
jgi:hypothetical protein